jgi:hypothetical protein
MNPADLDRIRTILCAPLPVTPGPERDAWIWAYETLQRLTLHGTDRIGTTEDDKPKGAADGLEPSGD